MNLDYLYNGKLHGDIETVPSMQNLSAFRPLSGQSGFRGLAGLLQKDEWKAFDTAVIEVMQRRMNASADLLTRDLTQNITNPMGTTVLEWEDISEMPDASVSMDATTRGQNDRIEYTLQGLPLPIIHEDFYLNERMLEASRNQGNGIDTTMVTQATRKVAEKIESIVLDGLPNLTFGSYSVTGYTNDGNRNTKSFSNGNWDASGTASTDIVNDVIAMKQESINDRHYGPWVLYIPTAYESVLDEDYSTSTSTVTTVRERIMQIGGIESIKVNDFLSANNVLLVELSRETVDMVVGFEPRVLQWDTDGMLRHNFKVMAIMIPRIKADSDGRSGIVHLS